MTARNQRLCGGKVIANLLCILGTDRVTFAAENALAADNVRLTVRHFERFYGTVSYAFVTVFAIGFFRQQTMLHSLSPQPAHNFVVKKFFNGFGLNGINFIADFNAYSVDAVFHAERAAQLDLVGKIIKADERLKAVDDIARAFKMT